MTPSSGARLGPYALVRKLGAGGSGEVWEAVLNGPGGFRKPVALKLLREGPTAGARRDELLHEARLGALLQHPNVVGTWAVGEHDGAWYVAMELVRGAPLSDLVRAGPLPPAAVLDAGAQAAEGLAYVHGLRVDGQPAGLVHRDVKLANLLLDVAGLVKLADLGISVLAGERAEAAGTPGYAAPEQIAGRPEAASDLFSLGSALYVLATRRRPFGAGEVALRAVADVERHLAAPEFLAPVEAAVPGLGEIVRRCLRADPRDRPGAREVADTLAGLRSRAPAGPSLLDRLVDARPELRETTSRPSLAPTRVLPRGNLPPARDRFFGREIELDALGERIGADRLLVLLGPGGTGKTRLATEAARRAEDRLSGGAWVYDLTEARSVEGLCGAMAAALPLQLEAADPVGQIGRVLARRGPSVVVLDNLEQCAEAAAAAVGRWVGLAPEVTFLCTSRVALRAAGERTVPVGALSSDAAAALFADRAPAPPADADRADVDALCAALDGLPLAIELAAARLRVMGVRDLRRRLGLALLSGGRRDLPERHRSLEVSLEWSWELLSPAARVALAQLAVFEGGFLLEAGEAVLDLAGSGLALDVLQELVEASLLHVDREGGRFGLALVVREFALARLDAPVRRAAEARHGAHYAQRVELLRAGSEHWHTLAADLDNLLAACRRAVESGDAAVAVPTLRVVYAVLIRRGPISEASALASAVLALSTLEPAARATVELIACDALRMSGRMSAAVAHGHAALAQARIAGARGLEATVLQRIGMIDRAQGRLVEAGAAYEAALAIRREQGERADAGFLHDSLGLLDRQRGRVDEARAHFEASLAAHRAFRNRRGEAVVRSHLAALDLEQGRTAASAAGAAAGLEAARGEGDRWTEGILLGILGSLDLEGGAADGGRARFEQALAIQREFGDTSQIGATLGGLGQALQATGAPDEARSAIEAAVALQREVGNRLGEGMALQSLGALELEQRRLPEAARSCEAALAAHREVGNRRFEGRVLVTLARVAAARGDRTSAAELLDVAEALLREVRDVTMLAWADIARIELALLAGEADAHARLAEARRAYADLPRIVREIDRLAG